MSKEATEKKENKKTGSFWSDFLMGGTSGAIAKTANAPLERVKIILQTQQNEIHKPTGTTATAGAGAGAAGQQTIYYTGIIDALKRIPQHQGYLSFWRGNVANCLRYFPTQAMNFAFKDKYQSMFILPRETVSFGVYFGGYLLAGGAAGATALTASYPLEFVFTRMAADKGNVRKYNGIIDCVRQTLATDGVRGIYRGYAPSVAGIVIYRAGYFGFYDIATKEVLPSLGYDQHQQHSLLFICFKFFMALGIDICASLAAYPLDTIRRGLMMQSGKPKDQVLFTNTKGAFDYIVKHEGARGLYKGAFVNSIRAVGSALVLLLYDEIKFRFSPNQKSSTK